MGKILMSVDGQGTVTAVATTVVNGSQRRIMARVPKAVDDDSLGKEQWRQCVFELFDAKDRARNGADEPEQESQWQR